LYLNLIEWGDGFYGAEAAARTYFHKSATDLSASESALLAAAIANPRVLSPAHPSARLLRRQKMVMRRMGNVTPPPAVAGPAVPPPDAPMPDIQPLPDLPPAAPASDALPGQPTAAPRGPGSKPPGGL
jgi:hypothetical protein